MTLTARQLYFEAVKVGDELPPLVKPPVDRLQIARYVGASNDYNPLSCDEHHAKNAGFPALLAPGMLGMGFLAELVVDWVRGARLRKFQARFVKIVWPGDVLTSRGRVVDRRFEEGGRYAIDVEVWAENQRGELAVRGLATVQLFYSAEDEARQRAGGPPLVVTPAEEEARLAKLSRAQPSRAAPKPPPAKPAPVAARPPAAVARPAPAPARPVLAAPARPAAATPARPAPPPPAPVRPAAPVAKPTPAAKPVSAAKPVLAGKPASAAKPLVAGKPAPAAKPAAAAKAPVRPAARPVAVAKPAAAPKAAPVRPAAKARPAVAAPRRPEPVRARPPANAGKAKPARPAARAAKRPASKEKAAAARSRSRVAAKKPSGKKRR